MLKAFGVQVLNSGLISCGPCRRLYIAAGSRDETLHRGTEREQGHEVEWTSTCDVLKHQQILGHCRQDGWTEDGRRGNTGERRGIKGVKR